MQIMKVTQLQPMIGKMSFQIHIHNNKIIQQYPHSRLKYEAPPFFSLLCSLLISCQDHQPLKLLTKNFKFPFSDIMQIWLVLVQSRVVIIPIILYILKKKPFYLNTHLIENCFQTQLLYTKSLIYLFIFKTFCEVAYLIG